MNPRLSAQDVDFEVLLALGQKRLVDGWAICHRQFPNFYAVLHLRLREVAPQI